MAITAYLPDTLPYVTLLVFLVGMTWRIRRWSLGAPSATLLFPLPETKPGRCKRMVLELCLLRGAHSSDFGLWIGAWPLHVALALIAVGHVRAFVDFPRLWAAMGLTPADVDTLAGVSGGAVGLAVMAACLYLLARRALVRRVREITRFEDVFTLVLLLAVIASGNVMRFGSHVDLELVRNYFAALATLHPVPMPAVPGFATHFLLAQLLAVWAPWSKLVHIPGVVAAKMTLSHR